MGTLTVITAPERQSAFKGILNVGLILAHTLLNGRALSRETAQIVRELVVPISPSDKPQSFLFKDGYSPFATVHPKKQNAKRANRTVDAPFDFVLW